MFSKIIDPPAAISGKKFYVRRNNILQILKHKNYADNNLTLSIISLGQRLFGIKNTPYRFLRAGSYLLIISISLTLLSSCNIFSRKNAGLSKLVVYPEAPETARFQYLTKISNSSDIGGRQKYFAKIVLGEEKGKRLTKPYGMAVRNGKIYVCDNYGGGMEVIDLERKKITFFQPGGKGALKTPINCYVDEKGYLYVADAGRLEIVIFDNLGNYVKSVGEKYKPSDVCVYDNKIFVANIANSKINVYSNDSENKLLYTFPEAEQGAPEFLCMPTNLTVSDGKVYVSDFGCSRIKIFTTDGKFIQDIGSIGDSPGTFSKIKGIAVDKEANIFAVDASFDNVQIFNKEGQLLMPLSGHYDDLGPGGLVLPAKVVVDYDNLSYFQKYVDDSFDLKYLVFVTSQYGPDLINVYGRVELKNKPAVIIK